MSHIVEVVTFKLAAGADEAAFLEAASRTVEWLHNQSGFLRRELTQTSEGWWIDIVHWADLHSAHSTTERLMSAPEGEAFMRHIDLETAQMYHATPRLGA
jgi:hypothetical protein